MKKSVEKSVNIENGCPVKIAENSTENVGEGGGCPVVHRAIDNQSGSIDVEKEYLTFSARQTRDLFNGLRDQTEQIEDHIGQGEREVLLKDEIAFLMRRHEVAISNLVHAQNVDYQKLKDRLESIITARSERKKAKREARVSIRSSKKRDQIIQQQEKAANAAFRVRETISERRAAFDLVTQHMYEMHEKQRKNMIQSQERRFQNEKLLVDLETRHLKEEVRSALQKKFQVRQNHQQHLNKRINDNLREVQLMELRHSKERFELEMVSFEEVGNKEIIRETTLDSLKLRHLNEMHNEKENVLSKHEQEKEDMLKAQHAKELRLLQHEQRIEIRQLKIKQDQIIEARKGIRKKQGSKTASQGGSNVGSNVGSIAASRTGSNESLNLLGKNSTNSSNRLQGSRVNTAVNKLENVEREEDLIFDTTSSIKASNSLKALIQRHKEELTNFENQCKQEINDCQLSFEAKMQEMQEHQEEEVQALVEEQERQLRDMKTIQEKEIQMEELMHDSEMKMLVERRILNSVLETVADGIINITPVGEIVRFNHAAELMFGYISSEVIGNNITMLMPEHFAKDHHTFLTNYLTTGVKKVIGIGRRVAGLRKNGQEFPLHLSISEMKENGEHLFTGIARDLTKEVEQETRAREIDEQKQKELENLGMKLDKAKQKANNLLSQMLPTSVSKQLLDGHKVEPQQFQSATVCFLDVVGFSSITSLIEPLDTVTFLNELYKTIDHVIEKYDVYKVETVGDTYLVVGGVPKQTMTHASEIATMSLHILYAIEQFQFSSKPDIKVRMRIGINSGPLVAGVIGTKMPRYCLFGDTVNTSSRMESNGEAGRIHISESTFNLLKKDGSFELTKRGEIDVKGKGTMTTYWVDSKMDFDPAYA